MSLAALRGRPASSWGRAVAAVALSALALVGCPEKPLGPGGGTGLSTIIISPDTASVAVSFTHTYAAYGLNAAGDTLSGITFYWSSQAPTTASISSSTGTATGVAVGSAQIAASAQGISGYATVIVTSKPIDTVIVEPTNLTLRIATSYQLNDTIKDISGNVVNASATWNSSNSAIAAVDQTGRVTALTIGTANITASYGGKTGTSVVTVSAVPVKTVVITSTPPSIYVGQTTQLTAQPEDSVGNPLSGRVVHWTSLNTAVATVDTNAGAIGTVTGVFAGTAGIYATSEGVNSSPITVTVATAPPSTVALSPSVSLVHVGAPVTLTATVTNNLGQIIPNPTVTFTSSNNAIAMPTGAPGPTSVVTTGPQTGTATITGTDGTATGTATITVALVGVDSVHVSAPMDTLTLGQGGETLTATAYDSSGNALSGRTFSWISSNQAVATIGAATGIVTPKSAGTAVMFATTGGVTGSLVLVVNAVPVATVIIVPAVDTLLPLGQIQLTDTLKDANGNVLTGRTVSWLSSMNPVATVSSTGLVTGVAAGSTQISATSGSAVGYNTTVVLAPVQTVTVTPPSQTITTAQTAQFTATLTDINNNVLTGRTVVWTSSASSSTPPINVSQTGLVTPTGPTDTATNVTITATVNQPTGSRSGTATVTVTLVPVASVVVYPTPVTIWATSPLNTIQLNDSTKDAGGNNLTNRPVTWTPTSGGVATVNASGLVSATNTAAGSAMITATAIGGANGSGTVNVLGHTQTVNTNFLVALPSDTLSATGATPGYINSTNVTLQILDSFGNDVTASRVAVPNNSDPTTIRTQNLGGNVWNVAAISQNSATVTLSWTVTDPGPLAVISATTTITIVP